MSAIPGTSCLLTELDDPTVPARPARAGNHRPPWAVGASDPGDDTVRAALAATTGRAAVQCIVCGVPVSETFTRRSKSGKTFCQVCADRRVAAYYARHPDARHPEARPTTPTLARERTGTAYLAQRDRYEARYHAGHARWQIADTQVRRWTSQSYTTEAAAVTAAARMNTLWREQIAHEQQKGAD